MRIGYSAWGFISDYKVKDNKQISTPDGNATYSWSILYEAQRRKHRVYWLQENRDIEVVSMHSKHSFDAFSKEKRHNSYWNCHDGRGFPELDVVLIEWRFRIPGRNCEVDPNNPDYQPDLDRQKEILRHYKNEGTPVILWDLDHKLTFADEKRWDPSAVFETAVKPKHQLTTRTRVEPPICIDDLYQFMTQRADKRRKLVYIGSRYERDDVINEWIKPVSEMYPQDVQFWGNWMRSDTLKECKKMWPNISYNRRITVRDFHDVYKNAIACPLLGKKSYFECGFITPRVWEALMFGTIPIGLSSHLGIEEYTLFTARDSNDLIDIVDHLANISLRERDDIRHENIEKIRFMGAHHFMDKIEAVVNT